jgi:integrase
VSLYRKPRSPYWHFDFQVRGHRFHGSTKTANKREAEKLEAAERERAKQYVAQLRAARASLKLDDVAGRYWQEVGQHHAGARDTWRELTRLIARFGKDTLLTDITDNDVAALVAWRHGHQARNLPQRGNLVATTKFISPFTVNATTKQLRKLFTRAKLWGVRFDHEPRWRNHVLKVPQERVRELAEDEAAQLEAATRDDLAPFFTFARGSGLRLRECLLRWSEVDWSTRQIRKLGKGGKLVTVPITETIREILWPLQGHHPEHVFTFVADRTTSGRVKGRRYPLTYQGVRSAWWQIQKRSGVVGFRFHDFRHDFGTKLLRETGNLKLVQRALNHSDIKTTTRYAHVLDTEVAEAMEAVAKLRKRRSARFKAV